MSTAKRRGRYGTQTLLDTRRGQRVSRVAVQPRLDRTTYADAAVARPAGLVELEQSAAIRRRLPEGL